jgi:hypothetical protein
VPAAKQMPAKYNSHELQSSTLNTKHLLQFQQRTETLIFKMLILSNLGTGKAIPGQALMAPGG